MTKQQPKKISGDFGIFQHPLIGTDIDEILERKVSKLGNSGHISVPSKHIGKNARVIIKVLYTEEETKEEVKVVG